MTADPHKIMHDNGICTVLYWRKTKRPRGEIDDSTAKGEVDRARPDVLQDDCIYIVECHCLNEDDDVYDSDICERLTFESSKGRRRIWAF